MLKEQYIYAVTRVHNHEQNLLSAADIEQLISAADLAEVFRLLSDKGWGGPDVEPGNADALTAYETKKTWDLIEELAGDVAPFNVFRYANDYHNLKAAIKVAYSASDDPAPQRYYQQFGTVPVQDIINAAKEHDFSALPQGMQRAGQLAYEILAQTGNGQLCDMAIDTQALLAIDEAGQKSGSELLRRYARLMVDSANIKAAVRCCLMGKEQDFIQRAVASAGGLDAGALVKAASQDLQEIYSYLRTTEYAGAVDALQNSMASFERWCDNQIIEMIRPQRVNYFTIEPMAAFILGRENEIRMVRLVLSARINGLSNDLLRERLRDMYV